VLTRQRLDARVEALLSALDHEVPR
jgi:hypothetical protein